MVSLSVCYFVIVLVCYFVGWLVSNYLNLMS